MRTSKRDSYNTDTRQIRDQPIMRLVDVQVDFHDYGGCDPEPEPVAPYYSVEVCYHSKHEQYSARQTFDFWTDAREFISKLNGFIEVPTTEGDYF